MCRKTDALRGPLARRRASIDPSDTPLDVAWMHGVCRKRSVDALETRARVPKARVVGRYAETDRRNMDAGRIKMDPDPPKTCSTARCGTTRPSGPGVRSPLSPPVDPVRFLRNSRALVTNVSGSEIADMCARFIDRRLIPGTARAALRRHAGLPHTFSTQYTARTGST